jgi:tRNA pseudouridine38-40 synthase
MVRYFIEVMYNGTLFHGSQLQGTTPTVQLAINNALSTLLRTNILSYGASRTDEGVHAMCNYYHFDVAVAIQSTFQYRMNAILPPGIAINKVLQPYDPEMNARFAAVSRRYRYKIYSFKNPFLAQRALFYPLKLNEQILHETAAVITEFNDFEAFSKRNTQSRTSICRIFSSSWERHGDELHYVVEANRFLRGMVRAMVGTQLQVARGKVSKEGFRGIIAAKDCTKADFSVAGHGLYLEHIEYPENSLHSLM